MVVIAAFWPTLIICVVATLSPAETGVTVMGTFALGVAVTENKRHELLKQKTRITKTGRKLACLVCKHIKTFAKMMLNQNILSNKIKN